MLIIHPQKQSLVEMTQLIFGSPIPFTKKNLTSFKVFAAWIWSTPRFLISFPFCQRKSDDKKKAKQTQPHQKAKRVPLLETSFVKRLARFLCKKSTTQELVFCQKVLGP